MGPRSASELRPKYWWLRPYRYIRSLEFNYDDLKRVIDDMDLGLMVPRAFASRGVKPVREYGPNGMIVEVADAARTG